MSRSFQPPASRLSRRAFVAALPLALAACTTRGAQEVVAPVAPPVDPMYVSMYSPIHDEPHPVPGINVQEVDQRYFRQIVPYSGPGQAGEIVVDPSARFLYLLRENGEAMRYGVGVGQAGFDYQGRAMVGRKASWPRWTPTQNMITREPDRYGPFASGLDGGIENPLGARALYLFNNGVDTLYRIHGTNEPWSIGRSVSSGCIRLWNQDIIDLHRRVPVGTAVTVLSSPLNMPGMPMA